MGFLPQMKKKNAFIPTLFSLTPHIFFIVKKFNKNDNLPPPSQLDNFLNDINDNDKDFDDIDELETADGYVKILKAMVKLASITCRYRN